MARSTFSLKLLEVEDPDLAVEIADIFHDLMGAGFPQRELIGLRREPLDQLYKGIDSKGIVLGEMEHRCRVCRVAP